MNVKTLDYKSKTFKEDLVKSFKETGFAVVSNVDFISANLIDKSYEEWKTFFNSKEKFQYEFDKVLQSGYFPFKIEKAKDAKISDLKEFFHIHQGALGSKLIPKNVDSTLELMKKLQTLGEEILVILGDHYNGKGAEWKQMVSSSPSNLLRILHYPPIAEGEDKNAVRAHAHQDISFLSALPASTEPGLEVKDNKGNWHPVGADKGSIILNIGDMLELLTKNYYPSTTHRVVNPKINVSRYSMPMFLHPHPKTQLSEDKTAEEFLNERLKEIGLKS